MATTNKTPLQRTKNIFATTIFILLVVYASSYLFATLFEKNIDSKGAGNVAIIAIKGPIVGEDSSGLFGETVASSKRIIALLEKAEKNTKTQAIVLEINSPGGTPVASDEIATAIKKLSKPTVAWIRETGASGAYWIASSTEHIIANRMSVTGSIGVVGSYLEFSGLLDDYNVSYQRLVSGKYKDAGSPFRPLTGSEEAIIQGKLDRIREIFITEVAQNRNLSISQVSELATGMYYLGEEAKEYQLIDELGGIDEVSNYLKQTHNISAEYYTLQHDVSWSELFANVMTQHGYAVGEGLGQHIITKAEVKV